MKVKAKISFFGVIDGKNYPVAEGDILDLPAGAESWLNDGLVEPVEEETEKATAKPSSRKSTRSTSKKAAEK